MIPKDSDEGEEGEVEINVNLCPKCKENERGEFDVCPHKEAMSGDTDELCACCDKCREGCNGESGEKEEKEEEED